MSMHDGVALNPSQKLEVSYLPHRKKFHCIPLALARTSLVESGLVEASESVLKVAQASAAFG